MPCQNTDRPADSARPTTAPPRPPPSLRPLALAPLVDGDREPVVLGIAAVDGSGRVRERAVLAALGWGRGDLVGIRLAGDIAVLHPAAAPRQ